MKSTWDTSVQKNTPKKAHLKRVKLNFGVHAFLRLQIGNELEFQINVIVIIVTIVIIFKYGLPIDKGI